MKINRRTFTAGLFGLLALVSTRKVSATSTTTRTNARGVVIPPNPPCWFCPGQTKRIVITYSGHDHFGQFCAGTASKPEYPVCISLAYQCTRCDRTYGQDGRGGMKVEEERRDLD